MNGAGRMDARLQGRRLPPGFSSASAPPVLGPRSPSRRHCLGAPLLSSPTPLPPSLLGHWMACAHPLPKHGQRGLTSGLFPGPSLCLGPSPPCPCPCPGWRLLRPPLLALAVLPTGGPPSRSFATPDSSLPDELVRVPSPPPERERPEGGGRRGLVSCRAVPQPRCPAGTFLGRVDGDGVPVRRRAAESGTESPGRVTGRAGTPGPSSGAHCRAAVFNSNLVSGSFC